MLTALIILLISRIRKNRLIRKKILFFFLLAPALLNAQKVKYNYEITRYGRNAGKITLLHTREGNRDLIHLEAFVKTNLVIGIRIKNIENIISENGRIVQSSFHRAFNSSSPATRTIKFHEDHYLIEYNGNTRKLNVNSIKLNMVNIYLNEPDGETLIYSDAAEKFLKVKQISNGIYQVFFPDGGFNIYHFQNKICRKIEVKQKLFHAEIHLRSINQL